METFHFFFLPASSAASFFPFLSVFLTFPPPPSPLATFTISMTRAVMSVITTLLVNEKDFFFDVNRSRDVTSLYNDCALLGLSCFCVIVLVSSAHVIMAIMNWWVTRGYSGLDGGTLLDIALAARSILGRKTVQNYCTHGVSHIAVIMDGNRRYGRRVHDVRKAFGADDMNTISQLCKEICSHRSCTSVVCDTATSLHTCLDDDTIASQEGGDARVNHSFRALLHMIRYTPFQGHYYGGDKLLEFISYCVDCDIKMVTVYAFSTENWSRPVIEVDVIMTLFMIFFHKIRAMAHTKGLFIRFVSTEPHRLPACVLELMRTIEIESRAIRPRNITVNVCVSYSGKSEIVKACNKLLTTSRKSRPITDADMDQLMLRSITQDDFEAEDALLFSDLVSREPELLMRTSGESRISNFLLYEVAYSEFVFIKKTWPEVTKADLIVALRDYAERDRRLGR